MDGIPDLNLWDLVIQVFHSSPIKTNKPKDVKEPRRNESADVQPNMRNHIPTKHTNFDPTNIDHVPPNGTHSEDNEAVMEMESHEVSQSQSGAHTKKTTQQLRGTDL